jgi:hypothetical protein
MLNLRLCGVSAAGSASDPAVADFERPLDRRPGDPVTELIRINMTKIEGD